MNHPPPQTAPQLSQTYQRRNDIPPLRNVQIPQYSGNKIAYCRVPQISQFAFNVPRSSPQWHLFKSFEMGMKALDKLTPINPDKYFVELDSRSYSKYSKVRGILLVLESKWLIFIEICGELIQF